MKIKPLLIGAIAAAALSLSAVSSAQAAFAALAMTPWGNGWGYATGGTMEQARQNAILQCELRNGRGACSISVAEQDYWFYTGISCANGSYVAASPQGQWRSDELAFWKASIANDYRCAVVTTQGSMFVTQSMPPKK